MSDNRSTDSSDEERPALTIPFLTSAADSSDIWSANTVTIFWKACASGDYDVIRKICPTASREAIESNLDKIKDHLFHFHFDWNLVIQNHIIKFISVPNTSSSPKYAAVDHNVQFMRRIQGLKATAFKSAIFDEWAKPGSVKQAPIVMISNASGTGKTTNVIYIVSTKVFGFMINTSTNEISYPKATSVVAKKLMDLRKLNCEIYAYLYIGALFLACLEALAAWLEINKATPIHQLKAAWMKLQGEEVSFWSEICSHADTLMETITADSLRGIDEARRSTMEKYVQDRNARQLNQLSVDVKHAWKEKIGLLLKEKFLEVVGTIHTKYFKSRKYVNFEVLFFFDEPRALLPINSGDICLFKCLKFVASCLPKRPATCFVTYTDTISPQHIFSPTGDDSPSRKHDPVNDPEYVPLWAGISDCVYPDCDKSDWKLGEVRKIENYSVFGRPQFKALMNAAGNDASSVKDILDYFEERIGGSSDNLKAAMSVLMYLVCFNVNGEYRLAHEVVCTYMHRCCGITKDRFMLILMQAPEPTLGVVARRVVLKHGWLIYMKFLNEARNVSFLLEGAWKGETACKILLMMIFNYLHELIPESPEKETDIAPVKLLAVLHHLGVRTGNIPQSQHQVYHTIVQTLQNVLVRCIQVVPNDSDPDQRSLYESFTMACMYQCRPGYKGIDGWLGAWKSQKHLTQHNVFSELNETVIPEDDLFMVFFQWKVNETPLCSKEVQEVFRNMNDANALQSGYWNTKRKLAVRIFMDLGPSKEDNPHCEVFMPKDNDIWIYVRGARPGHIFQHASPELKKALDEQFEKLTAGQPAPHKNPFIVGNKWVRSCNRNRCRNSPEINVGLKFDIAYDRLQDAVNKAMKNVETYKGLDQRIIEERTTLILADLNANLAKVKDLKLNKKGKKLPTHVVDMVIIAAALKDGNDMLPCLKKQRVA